MGHPPKFFHAITNKLPEIKGEFTRFESKIGLRPLLYNRGAGFLPIENKADQLDLFDDFAFGFEELIEGGISSVYQTGRDIVRVQMAGADPLSYQIGGLAPPASPITVEGVKSYRDGSTMVDYEDFMPGADLRITLGGHVVSKQVFLKAGHPRHLAFRIFTDQVAEQLGDSLIFGENWKLVLPYLIWGDPESEAPKAAPQLETELRRKSRDKWFDRDYYELVVALPPGNWDGWIVDPTVIWQPGASGKDSYVYEHPADVNRNYGNATVIKVGATGNIPNNWINRSFIEFDLVSAIPPGSTILSMSMRLWTQGVVKWGGETHTIHRCNAAWNEALITWNNQPGTVGAVVASAAPADPVTFNFNLAQAILMYQTNNGLRIYKSSLPEDESNCDNNYQSSDHATALERPELTIEYTPPAYKRLATYTLNVWEEPKFMNQIGQITEPNEIRPNHYLGLEGISLPGSKVYDSFVEDPTKIRIVEAVHQDGKAVPQIKSDRNQFGETITARAAGGQA